MPKKVMTKKRKSKGKITPLERRSWKRM